jgi:hypothetical protein
MGLREIGPQDERRTVLVQDRVRSRALNISGIDPSGFQYHSVIFLYGYVCFMYTMY